MLQKKGPNLFIKVTNQSELISISLFMQKDAI